MHEKKQRLRCKMRFEKKSRLRSGYDYRCHVCVYACVCFTAVMLDTTEARCWVRAWGLLYLCLWHSHPPQSPDPYVLGSLTARVCSKNKQHAEQPRQLGAAIGKAHGGVIDVGCAPCQPSGANGRRWPHSLYSLCINRMKNQHGHGVCWMSTGRKNALRLSTHTWLCRPSGLIALTWPGHMSRASVR